MTSRMSGNEIREDSHLVVMLKACADKKDAYNGVGLL